MKKKITIAIACVLTLAFVFAMPGAVFAADITAPGTSNTTMTYAVASSYTVVIPDAVTINADKTGSLIIGVNAGALIASGTSIEVTLTTCDFTLTNGDDELAYTITNDASATIAVNGNVLTHAAGTTTASSEVLSIAVTGNPKYSGSYTDQITFTVTVE